MDGMPVTAYYTEGTIPQLSATRTDEVVACKIKYLNEGGANFVYSILKAGLELPKPLRGKLLRLRKDLSHVQSTKEQVESFNNNFRPLFPPDCLVLKKMAESDPTKLPTPSACLAGECYLPCPLSLSRECFWMYWYEMYNTIISKKKMSFDKHIYRFHVSIDTPLNCH